MWFLDVFFGLLLLPASIADSLVQDNQTFNIEEKTIQNKTFKVYIADNPSRQKQGFKYKKVKENEAMLFNFSVNTLRAFWMKDTVSALDIVFLDKNYQIKNIVKNAKPCSLFCKPYFGVGKYVIEFKAGVSDKLGLKKGQKIVL